MFTEYCTFQQIHDVRVSGSDGPAEAQQFYHPFRHCLPMTRAPPTSSFGITMAAPLTEDKLASRSNPFVQFRVWYDEAAKELPKPGVMCLSTCSKAGKPSSRNVQF